MESDSAVCTGEKRVVHHDGSSHSVPFHPEGMGGEMSGIVREVTLDCKTVDICDSGAACRRVHDGGSGSLHLFPVLTPSGIFSF